VIGGLLDIFRGGILAGIDEWDEKGIGE